MDLVLLAQLPLGYIFLCLCNPLNKLLRTRLKFMLSGKVAVSIILLSLPQIEF